MKKRRTQFSGKASFLPVLPAGDLERWLTERCQSDQNFKTRSPAGSQNFRSPESTVGRLDNRKKTQLCQAAVVTLLLTRVVGDMTCRFLGNHMTHADLGILLSS